MIVATGIGFVSFFCLYPFNPQKPLRFFWRWVTPSLLPPCFFSVSFSSTCEHERFNGSKDALCWGGCRGRERAADREVERKRGRKMGDRDGLISTSSSYSSKPASSSEARQDLACPQPGQAACLRAGLPPGGPWDGRAAPKKNNYSDWGRRCVRSQLEPKDSFGDKLPNTRAIHGCVFCWHW